MQFLLCYRIALEPLFIALRPKAKSMSENAKQRKRTNRTFIHDILTVAVEWCFNALFIFVRQQLNAHHSKRMKRAHQSSSLFIQFLNKKNEITWNQLIKIIIYKIARENVNFRAEKKSEFYELPAIQMEIYEEHFFLL